LSPFFDRLKEIIETAAVYSNTICVLLLGGIIYCPVILPLSPLSAAFVRDILGEEEELWN
jgi:hypothetical protein